MALVTPDGTPARPSTLSAETRTSVDGTITVIAMTADPTVPDVVPCRLRDLFGRFVDVDLRASTGLVLLPAPLLGEIPFDPQGRQEDGRWVFAQRATMNPADVETVVRNVLAQLRAASESTRPRVLKGPF